MRSIDEVLKQSSILKAESLEAIVLSLEFSLLSGEEKSVELLLLVAFSVFLDYYGH